MSKFEVTHAAYHRHHGHVAAGKGLWFFAPATFGTAFDNEINRENTQQFYGTMTDLRKFAREQGLTGLWAILP